MKKETTKFIRDDAGKIIRVERTSSGFSLPSIPKMKNTPVSDSLQPQIKELKKKQTISRKQNWDKKVKKSGKTWGGMQGWVDRNLNTDLFQPMGDIGGFDMDMGFGPRPQKKKKKGKKKKSGRSITIRY